MTQSVYALYTIDPATGAPRYFYVGRSNATERRLREHHYRKRIGHEDVYVYIRALAASGICWYHETLTSVDATDYCPDHERWHVIDLTRKGHSLMNMRHWDRKKLEALARQVLEPRIRSAADVAHRRKRAAFRASRRRERKVWRTDLERALRFRGLPSMANDDNLSRLMPVASRRLGTGRCERGISLKELVLFARGNPFLDRLGRRIEETHPLNAAR